MTQVWLIDYNGFYQNESKFVEEVKKGMITVPLLTGYVKPLFNGTEWVEGATKEEIQEWKQSQQIDICLDDLKQDKIKDSKIKLEDWLSNNPLLSTVHNPNGEYYTVTDDKQNLLARNLLFAKCSNSETTTWNSTPNVCEVWTVAELSQLAQEIETYVRPRITKQQHYEVKITACTTKEELDAITFDYEVI